MISDATPKEKERMLNSLRLENAQYQRHAADRPYWAVIAKHDYGLTNQQIADAYGITEAAVRGLIKRAK